MTLLPIRPLAAGAILALGAGAARANFKSEGAALVADTEREENEAELHAVTKLVELYHQEAAR